MRRMFVCLVSLVFLATLAPPANAAPGGRSHDYIVVLKSSVSDPGQVADEHSKSHGARLSHVYQRALKGYSASMSEQEAANVAADSRVAFVELDGPVHAVDSPQLNPDWGLDRLDQTILPLDQSYAYGAMGAGVTAYIIDTGVRFTHSEFGGRAVSGFDAVTSGGTAADCNGHGTHVAGTVGGSTYGVAKAVQLVAVRVLGCTGSGLYSGVIAGVDWVTSNHQPGQPAVANMSLGGPVSQALDQAVQSSIADGVTYGVAAGNGNVAGVAQDACKFSPARVAEALTVGATSSTDAKASWSNYGTCVDLFAPGVGITSSWSTSDTATSTISGTSMAAPHVVGVAALYLEGHPTALPGAVASAVTGGATPGLVGSPGTGSPNLLLNSTFVTTPPPPPAPAIVLSAVKGTRGSTTTLVNLTWTNAVGPVRVVRSGSTIAASVSGPTYTDNKAKNGKTFRYKVCENGSTRCSNLVTVTT